MFQTHCFTSGSPLVCHFLTGLICPMLRASGIVLSRSGPGDAFLGVLFRFSAFGRVWPCLRLTFVQVVFARAVEHLCKRSASTDFVGFPDPAESGSFDTILQGFTPLLSGASRSYPLHIPLGSLCRSVRRRRAQVTISLHVAHAYSEAASFLDLLFGRSGRRSRNHERLVSWCRLSLSRRGGGRGGGRCVWPRGLGVTGVASTPSACEDATPPSPTSAGASPAEGAEGAAERPSGRPLVGFKSARVARRADVAARARQRGLRVQGGRPSAHVGARCLGFAGSGLVKPPHEF